MKIISITAFLLVHLFCVSNLHAKKRDTLEVSSSNINTKHLREGTHRYLVYFKMGKDSVRSQTQFWTRTIKRTDYKGMPVIEINQEWEDKDSIMHVVKSISDAKTMQPLYHSTWWKVRTPRATTAKTINVTAVDFLNKTVEHNGKMLDDSDTDKRAMAIWAGYKSSLDKYFLNWHLDLETFPLLPYKKEVTFLIPFYDPGTASNYQKVAYTVTGSADLIGYNDQKIDCWILTHESKGNKEIFWISKKTKEVLKLEQEINGTMYRYKIKLGFSV
ncbi:hypothetical protein LX77_01418 [Gelidibacter algens]|uniref:GLPGLI family protein n=1 Tax=Gelidibacter algens TaxID=49280 RepID=A0A1A7QNC6_9FLAO|nr:hypothetical protein [Gelidibacter algens]OBX20976.1 hypothetical protein A9996_18650 [Gelidibacter algens]RAJ25117.1 hypothetical protein LX77_01418 [Gelidibacter algens]